MDNRMVETWEAQYRDLEGDTALKDSNFFRIEVDAIRDQLMPFVQEHLSSDKKKVRILELGSGTGVLAEFLSNAISSQLGIRVQYLGVDFSLEACRRAEAREIPNAQFCARGFLEYLSDQQDSFDFIVTQRSIMALMERAEQDQLLAELKRLLRDDGAAVLSEGVSSGVVEVNRLREILGVSSPFESVWHSRYLDDDQIESAFPRVKAVDFGSTYWMLTQVVYPYFQEPKHNARIHDFASQLATAGRYCPIRIFVCQK